jgi:hypothetical protein
MVPAVPTQRFNFSPVQASPLIGAAKGGSIHIKHPGALHKELGVPKGEKIPTKKLAKAANSDNPVERKRAVFAENAKKWNHKASGGMAEEIEGKRSTGDRHPRKDGGRTKGKTNVNIIIATGNRNPEGMMGGNKAPPMALGAPIAAPPPAPGAAPMPQPVPGAAPGMGAPPPRPMPPGMPMRSAGGKLVEPGFPAAMKPGKGSGGGQGRKIKAEEYGA